MRGEARFGVLAAALWLVAPNAAAFCRTTTCDVDNPDEACNGDIDADGCTISGFPLYWPRGCTWFGVQQDGSPKLGITYDDAHPLIVQAFETWGNVKCSGGGKPSFFAADTDELYGKAVCNEHEFSQKTANANVWMFRDSDWPYIGTFSTIALTTLTVNLNNGEIFDADVEINSFGIDISTSDADVARGAADLESIVTHESGHFLGLAHSQVKSATMFASYSPRSVSIRSLETDDKDAICSLFPPSGTPSCAAPEPRYGFSRFCGGKDPVTGPHPAGGKDDGGGCSISGRGNRPAGWPVVALGAAALALSTRRSRRSRRSADVSRRPSAARRP